MRTPFVCGNWKMHKTTGEARALAREIVNSLRGGAGGVDVVVCPPFTALAAVGEVLGGSGVRMGAQNAHSAPSGAYTGEVSAPMLVDLGCDFVILGHSERRQLFGETDSGVREKLESARGAGLVPIVCVGETLEERESGRTAEVVLGQVRGALEGLPAPEVGRLILAYEPVWAIGTGKTATPEEAQEVHARIRAEVETLFGEEPAGSVRILYGGSMKPDNAADLLSRQDIDGGLIGGAALRASDFTTIVGAACTE
ncbi:MAG: triose-phosphate isomerase [Gemmatimonadota bacterium]|nr:triose-phosphate isomerase [Gemmatimonadota bacterium]MDP7032136.1 triose-phosphate isomerase [Gemmatimonadota bacterium]